MTVLSFTESISSKTSEKMEQISIFTEKDHYFWNTQFCIMFYGVIWKCMVHTKGYLKIYFSTKKLNINETVYYPFWVFKGILNTCSIFLFKNLLLNEHNFLKHCLLWQSYWVVFYKNLKIELEFFNKIEKQNF